MKSPLTLRKRLNFFFVLYSACIFIICCGLTLVSLYAIEDGFFDSKLKKVAYQLKSEDEYARQVETLNYGIVYYPSVSGTDFNHVDFGEGDVGDADFADSDVMDTVSDELDPIKYKIIEVSIKQRYYHILVLPVLALSPNNAERTGYNPSILVYDETDELLVTNSLDDLSTLFIFLFLAMAVATLFFSRFFSHIILKPFQKLLDVITVKSQNSELQHAQVKQLSESIKEEDIKTLVLTIANNLQKHEQLLSEQITFNKGISHELGTPLQVAKHALELIKPDGSISERAISRLAQALEKMEYTSEAFLWLTSNNVWSTSVDVRPVIENILSRNALLLEKHNVSVNMEFAVPCYFIAPPEVLNVVLENLLWNAVIG